MSDYTPTGAPPSNVKGNAAAIRNEFAAIAAAIASKAGLLSPNFTGTNVINYCISDGTVTNCALLTVIVSAVNDAPLLIAISTQAASDADLFSIWLDDAKQSPPGSGRPA